MGVALGAMLLGGCAVNPAPFMPLNYVRLPSVPVKTVGDRIDQSRLQVLIMYGGPFPSHTALRLVLGDGRVVFWDPAGDYGLFDDDMQLEFGPFPVPAGRRRDLLVTNTPDLATYIRFRWALEDTSVVVFEWDVTPRTARGLRDVLVNGTDGNHPAGRFSTQTFPPHCAKATADFLRRFGSPIVRLSDPYFWPQSLANALYAQSPSRVRVFVPDEGERVYSPPSLAVRY